MIDFHDMAKPRPVVDVLVREPLVDATASLAARRRYHPCDACFPIHHDHLAQILSVEN